MSAPIAHLLVIRFSSFGDIVQASGVPAAFKSAYPDGQVDWLVRSDLQNLLNNHPSIHRLIPFERSKGVLGLIGMAWELGRAGRYTHVYDAHNNVRSKIVMATLWLVSFLGDTRPKFATRPKSRIRRWLMFQFHISTLPSPFRGADSYHRPLIPWGLKPSVPPGPQFFSRAALPQDVLSEVGELRRPLIALAPAAAWKMKRWPVAHWKALVAEMPEAGFILLGGEEDRFVSEIADVAPDRCLNLAGRLKLSETSGVLGMSDLVIANDTGLLHVADQMERPTLALIGPTAFGYPSHATSEALELNLDCKPCSKDGSGGCKNEIYQRCLVDLKPGYVVQKARERLNTSLKP